MNVRIEGEEGERERIELRRVLLYFLVDLGGRIEEASVR